MTDPANLIPTQMVRQLAEVARSASSPITVVKHGRREDRAAAYDRFILACTRAVRERHQHDGMAEVWSTWQSIYLRADTAVCKAATALVERVEMVADPGARGDFERFKDEGEERIEDQELTFFYGRDLSQDEEVLFMQMMTPFVQAARLDLARRWWHGVLPGPVRRWYLTKMVG
ncbi:hypothetical protein H7827_18440 [Streptomyces sp. JH002]|uniref:hypothetical protein n=1 Tax=Streptomyces sp. JH002 TaxID=2763259 RepID=UPI003D808A80